MMYVAKARIWIRHMPRKTQPKDRDKHIIQSLRENCMSNERGGIACEVLCFDRFTHWAVGASRNIQTCSILEHTRSHFCQSVCSAHNGRDTSNIFNPSSALRQRPGLYDAPRLPMVGVWLAQKPNFIVHTTSTFETFQHILSTFLTHCLASFIFKLWSFWEWSYWVPSQMHAMGPSTTSTSHVWCFNIFPKVSGAGKSAPSTVGPSA